MTIRKAESGFNGHPRLHGMTESYTGSERCFQPGARGTADGPKSEKPPGLHGDLQNVDLALTRFRAEYARLFLSESNLL